MKLRAIARQTGVSHSSVYGLTRAVQRGFESDAEYRRHCVENRGFGSVGQYREWLAKRRGFDSIAEYNEHWAGLRGFSSYVEYQRSLALRRGFTSRYEYHAHLVDQRKKRIENRAMAEWIRVRLTELGMNQSRLAQGLGVSRQTVSRYARGESIPRGARLERLLEALCAGDPSCRDAIQEVLG